MYAADATLEKLKTFTSIHRQSEGINFLHVANQFGFNFIHNFDWYSVTILTQRMNAIRNLFMSYMFDGKYSKPDYGESWELHPADSGWTHARNILAGMKNL